MAYGTSLIMRRTRNCPEGSNPSPYLEGLLRRPFVIFEINLIVITLVIANISP